MLNSQLNRSLFNTIREWEAICLIHWWILSYCGKALAVEICSIQPCKTSFRSYVRRSWIEPVCINEGRPSGFRYCWTWAAASVLPLYWFMTSDKCPMGVVTAMEAEQLSVQRQINELLHYGKEDTTAQIENVSIKLSHVDRCPHTQESCHWRT